MKSLFSINYVFVVICLSFVIGIYVSPLHDGYVIISCFLILLMLLVVSKKKWIILFSMVSLFFCLGSARVYLHEYNLTKQASKISKEQSLLVFEVLNVFRNFDTTTVYKVKWRSYNRNEIDLIGLVYMPKDLEGLEIGKQYLSYNKLYPLQELNKPYADGYFNYLTAQHITHKMYVRKTPIQLSVSPSWIGLMKRFRTTLIKNIEKHSLSDAVASFVKAFVLGDRTSIDVQMKQCFKNAGLMHILAISGLHVGMLHQILLLLFRNIWYGYKYRWLKSILIILLLWAFAILVGASISVVRATLMFSMFELSSKLKREQHPLDVLLLFVFTILMIDPIIVRDVGFQLSVMAVLSIIIGMPLWKRLWLPKRYWMLKLWQLIGVTTFAQLGLLPLLIHYFHQFPTLFLIANIPVLVVLPFIFVCSVIFVVLAQLSFEMKGLVWCYEAIMHLFLDYITWISSFENTILKELKLDGVGVFIIYSILGFVLYHTYVSKMKFWKVVLSANLILVYLIINHLNSSQKLSLWFLEEKGALFFVDRVGEKLRLYSNSDKEEKQLRFLNQWSKVTSFESIQLEKIKNSVLVFGLPIQILDEECCFKSKKGRVYIVDNYAKLNMERLIKESPALVIFTSKNKSYLKEIYKETCEKHHISIWDMKEKGAYEFRLN